MTFFLKAKNMVFELVWKKGCLILKHKMKQSLKLRRHFLHLPPTMI